VNTSALICPIQARPADIRRLAYAEPQLFPVLFDSSARGALGRYSILAAYPQAALWQDRQGRLRYEGLDAAPAPGLGFLDALERLWLDEALPPLQPAAAPCEAHPVPFQGGWIVYLGYELAAQIEPRLLLPQAQGADAAPGALALRIPAALIYDHVLDRAWSTVEAGFETLHERLRADLALATCTASLPSPLAAVLDPLRLEEEDPQRFRTMVEAALEHIRAGDVYQINLSRCWHARLFRSAGAIELQAAAATLYERLRRLNPAPFAALLQFQGWRLLCSSPERLVRVQERRVETRPIAGTRARSGVEGEDLRELSALIAHPKERAEHIMLVDLERNDLGRICRAGSVRADVLMCTESYAHVHHIVSNVCGQLIDGISPLAVLRAVFPGGTITGCPKFRCMQLIAEIEGVARGAYTGALGYINREGSMDINILIRSMTMHRGALAFRAGAGIVADSDWQVELQETRAKARGLIAALQCE
jgi:anthranilate synthase component 1